ncbi:MAG: DUF4097 family beta strand repeat-containing protein [Candidatus Limnocylindria bacterium]
MSERHERGDDADDLEREIDRELEDVTDEVERELASETREAQREAHRIERDALREARRAAREADREARREGRRAHRVGLLGRTLTIETEGGREESELVEKRFVVEALPKLRIRNVSGDTSVTAGAAGEVIVRARKRVHGWSEDRAKRLLENVEIRMEQRGDEILVEPTLYQQERGWLDLFRGGRVAVDLEVTVPREAQIDATTVSGPLALEGTRGPIEARSVSGGIDVRDVQGPMRLRTVSGECRCIDYAGQVEANSVSGELRFERSRIRRPDIVTVSGEVRLDGALVPGGEGEGDGRIKTVSGDVELTLSEPSVDLDFQTLSGDVEVDAPNATVEKRGRREWHVAVGGAGARVKVKTVSGDLTIRRSGQARPAAAEAPSQEAMPMGAPAAAGPKGDVLELLQRVARGELSVEDAASSLDQRGR